MKKYAMTLLCSALAGLAWAADAPPPAAPSPLPPGAPTAVIYPPPAASGAVVLPECAPACVHKVCVPEPTVKKTDKVIYGERCVDYCLPKCSLLSLFSGHGCGCGDGGCLNCGCPRTRRVLIKWTVHEECPDTKCEVREQPVCPQPVAAPASK